MPIAALAINAGLSGVVVDATDLVLAIATFASLIGFINYGSRFLVTLAEDGLLPAKMMLAHKKFRSPFVAIVILGVVGLATIVALLVASGSLAKAYNSAATLVVYIWVLPYLLVTSGAIVLIARHRLRSPWVVASAVFGGATMGYCFISGIINPPPAPTNAMTWVAIVVIPLATAFLVINRKLRSRRDGENLAIRRE